MRILRHLALLPEAGAGAAPRVAVAAILSLLAPALLGAQRVAPESSYPRLLHLAAADSATVLSLKPLPFGPGHTVFLRFHPFVPIRDTLAVRRVATAVWRALRSEFEDAGYDHVVLQATEGDAARAGLFEHDYAVILARRPDGRWYFMSEGVRMR